MKKIGTGILAAFILAAIALAIANAQGAASIKFVKPIDRHNVVLGQVDVVVEITGVSLNNGYAWQLLIDGVPEPVLHGTTTTSVIMPDPSGPHRMKVVLLDPQGNTLASNEILVMAAPLEQIDPAFNRAWFAPVMGVFTLIVIGLIILGLRLRPRPAAWQD